MNQIHWSRSRSFAAVAGSALLFISVLVFRNQFWSSPVAQYGHRESSISSRTAIYNSTLGFEKIFAIGLPERTDRKDGLVLQAAVTGLDVNFIDGVNPQAIEEKVLPFDHVPGLVSGAIGGWRAHLNVIRQVVHSGLATALILEDDVDWDVRLKDLMHDTAVSINAALQNPKSWPLRFHELAGRSLSETSPYGHGWDVLWFGHCGMSVPDNEEYVIHYNDISAPQTQYLRSYDKYKPSPMTIFPNHTRIIGPPKEAVCSLAYAVSQSGARRILHELGLQKFDMAYDLMLRRFCEGEHRRCFGVLPQLFDHFRRQGPPTSDSDISVSIDPDREQPFTSNIQHSVRLNLGRILDGVTEFKDQFPDV